MFNKSFRLSLAKAISIFVFVCMLVSAVGPGLAVAQGPLPPVIDSTLPGPATTPTPNTTGTPAPPLTLTPTVVLTPTAEELATIDPSSAGEGTLFRARIQLRQPNDLARIQAWKIKVLSENGGHAFVEVDREGLGKLARLGFQPDEIDSLEYLATVYNVTQRDSALSLNDLARNTDILLSLSSVDSDSDGLTDTEEAWWCTNPQDNNSDSPLDPTSSNPSDGDEVNDILRGIKAYGPPFALWPQFTPHNPNGNCPDGDFDAVPDYAEEFMIGTSNLRESSDLDKFDDGQELFGVTYCPGSNGPCGYGILPRAEDAAFVSAILPAWVKEPGNSPFVAAFPEPEVEVVPSSLNLTRVATITTSEGTMQGTEKTYGTSSTKGASTSVADSVTWNQWEEVSHTTPDIASSNLKFNLSRPVDPKIAQAAIIGLAGAFATLMTGAAPAQEANMNIGDRICQKSDFVRNWLMGCNYHRWLYGPPINTGQNITNVTKNYIQQTYKVTNCNVSAENQSLATCGNLAVGVYSPNSSQTIIGQSPTTISQDLMLGQSGTGYYLNSDGQLVLQPQYLGTYPVPAPTTTISQGKEWGGSHTTTSTQYEEQTVSESSTKQFSQTWENATSSDTNHSADLRFTFHIVNNGTEYAREVTNLTFNIYIGNNPNPAATYVAVNDSSSKPKIQNLFPGDELTYTSEPIELTLDEMRAIDEGAPIRIVMEDISFGQDQVFYLDALNGSVTVAMEDGYDDLDETVDTYLVPVWDPSDTVQDIAKRYFPVIEDADGNLLAVFTPEPASNVPSSCVQDANIAPASNTMVYCKHALTGTSWWNFYLSDGLNYSGVFKDTLAAPNTTMLVRIVSDRDLDGYNDRNEIKLGTNPDDPASHPAPNLLAGYTKSCTGNDCTLRMTFQNIGNYDAYGVEAILYTPDGLVNITNNTIGGSGRVVAGGKVVVGASDTFQYTVTGANPKEPVIVVSYNDPQGNHRFIVPAAGLLSDLNADLTSLNGSMLPDPGVDIASTSSTQANFVIFSPHTEPIVNGKLFVEYIDNAGTVAHEDVFTQTFDPGPTVIPVTVDTATYPPDQYILLAFFTDSQGNILDSSARPLASFGADPSPEANLTTSGWQVGNHAVIEVADPWDFGTVQPGTKLHANLTLGNTGLGDLRYALSGWGSGLTVTGVASGSLSPSATRAFTLNLDTAGMTPGAFSRTLTLRTNDPYHGTITINLTGIIGTAGQAAAYKINDFRPWDQYVYVPGPHNQNDVVTFTHSIADPSRMYPLYLKTPDGSTLKGVGEYGVDFSGQTAPFGVFGDGRDGVMPGSGNLDNNNGVGIGIVNSGNAGSYSITVTDASSGWRINPGDVVLIHQTQGTGAGCWEMNNAVSDYLGDVAVIQLAKPLQCNYASGGNNHAQIQRVPQYTSCPVNGTVTPLASWNGTWGGILAVLCNGSMTITGALTADGKGFRGGQTEQVSNSYGYGGEGIAGTSGSGGNGTGVSPSGGGGNIDNSLGGNSQQFFTGGGGSGRPQSYQGDESGGGGGGGGHVYAGGGGASGVDSNTAGQSGGFASGTGGGHGGDDLNNYGNGVGGGGNSGGTSAASDQFSGVGGAGHSNRSPGGGGGGANYPDSVNGSTMIFGGGGGAGSRYEPYGGGHNQPGGSGGGIVIAFVRTLNIAGSLTANGVSGTCGSARDGCGGSGAGGYIYIKSAQANVGSNLISAVGGQRTGPAQYGGGGGAGSIGRIRIEYGTISGSTNPTYNPLQVSYYNLTGTSPTSLYMPEAMTSGNYIRYSLQYGQRSSNTSGGDQLFSVRLPNRQYSSVTMSALNERVVGSGSTFNFCLDIGNDGTCDYTANNQSFSAPVRLDSTNLASALNAYITAQHSAQEYLTIPIRVNISTPADIFLFNLLSSAGNDADLVPTNFTITPPNGNPASNIPEGSQVTLSAAVTNNGTHKAENFTVAFYNGDPANGGVLVGSTFIASLDGGATSPTQEVTWNTTGLLGDKMLYVKVDVSSAVAESNENNNAASAPAVIKKKADLLITSLTVPDARQGETVNAILSVKNAGEADVTGAVISLYDGTPGTGTLLNSTTVNVPKGATTSAQIPFSINTVGAHTLWAKADPANLVLEADETNNTQSASMHVGWNLLTIDTGGAGETAYTESSGYGWQNGTAVTSCGTGIEKSYRQAGSSETLTYKFDNLLPGRRYHLDLTFATCSGERWQDVLVDGHSVSETGSTVQPYHVTTTPQTVSLLLDPADFVDGTITLSIRRTSGLNGPLVNVIDLQEVNYCYRDSGPSEAPWSTDNHCGFDSTPLTDGFDGWGTLPEQTMRFGESGVNYKFDALDPAKSYNVRLTFFEDDLVGRDQRILFDGVEADTITLNSSAQYLVIAIPASAYADGQVVMSTQRIGGGEAIVNEVTLEEDTRRYSSPAAPPTPTPTPTPVPPQVTVSSFTATWGGSQVNVIWSTTTEINNHHFNLYRSTDTFTWTEIATTPSQFQCGNFASASPVNYFFTDTNVAYGMTYYYRLQYSGEGCGAGSAMAPMMALAMPLSVDPPASFGKTGPSNGATDLSLSLNLQWEESGGAEYYEYCYSTSNDGNCSTWIESDTPIATSITGLAPATTYYWQVRAVNSSDTTPANNGNWWSFTTLPNQVTVSGNAGVVGATVSYTGGTTTADAAGNYSFTVAYGWSGTVTPSKTGYTFIPASKSYTNITSDQTAQNYSAALIPYTISGNVGVAGATITYTGGSTTADGTGNYSFTVTYGWTGTVTPSKTGYNFMPVNKSYTNVTANQISQNYTAALINGAPTNIALSNSSVAENQPIGSLVGNLSTTDPDAGDTFAYSFCGGTDDASFRFSGNQLQTNAAFNYEAKSSYSVCVRSTDSGGLHFDKTFPITITDANDAPTNIALSNNTVAENLPVGTTVGTLTATDPDAGNTHTFALACAVPGADDAAFQVSGNALQTKAVFDFETKSSYNLCLRTNDGHGGTFDKNFTITVTDVPGLELLIPANGVTLLNNRPTFDWSDYPAAIGYNIQISRNNTFTLLVSNTNLTGGTNSTYTPAANLAAKTNMWWRVRAKLTATTYSGWSEVRAFTTANPPPAPLLVAPVANALVTSPTVKLDWNNISMPAGTFFQKYEVQMATDTAFTVNVTLADTPISEYTTPALTPNTKYYWRVRAYNSLGQYGNWSSVRYFRAALSAPNSLTPGTTLLPEEQLLTRRPTFTWNVVPGATGYTVEVSTVNTFATKAINANATTNSYTHAADLAANTSYFWRVKANGANGPSLYSQVRMFRTANPPSVPLLTAPLNNALVTTTTPLLNWNNSTVPAGATFDHYQIQIATNNTFTALVHDKDVAGLANSQDNTAVLPSGATYYWRVRSWSAAGDFSGWSAIRSVRIAYAKPILIAPSGVIATLKPTITWDAVTSATSYNFQVSKNTTFTLLVISKTVYAATYTHTTNLVTGTTYYWRVRVNGAYGPSAWSDYFTFTTP